MLSGEMGNHATGWRKRLISALRLPALVAVACLGVGVLGFAGLASADLGDGKVSDRLDEKSEAFRKWLPPAIRGDAAAQYELGLAFSKGRSKPEDYVEAARWLRKSAEQGNARAQSGLAILYMKGAGVRRDYVQAYLWYELAADQYVTGMRRDQALEMRNMMAAFMTPGQIEEAKKLVADRRATEK